MGVNLMRRRNYRGFTLRCVVTGEGGPSDGTDEGGSYRESKCKKNV